MDRVLNTKDEKQTIYEIYRACRLCGAGAGYKMPIIQNVVDLGVSVELRHKIKECVQIEVSHTDRMPPLICELCVDKVNDFYEFLDMCKQTNQRTRLRLGLPQTKAHDSLDRENCILGVTEPLCINDSDGDTPHKQRIKKSRVRKKSIEMENTRPSPKPEHKSRGRESRESSEESRWAKESRYKKRAPSPAAPKRTTRQSVEPALVAPQTEEPFDKLRLKRLREKDTKVETPPPPAKKLKIASEPMKSSRPGPKSSKNVKKEPNPPPLPPPPPKAIPKSHPAKPASKKDRKPSPPPPFVVSHFKLTTNALISKATPPKATPKSTPPKATPPKATPKAAPKTTPPKASPKAFYCQICNTQTNSSLRLSQHNSRHTPTFTNPKMACNACELWFPSDEEADAHHSAHRAQGLPYKCTRCYGYFKLQQAYEDHFGEDLCLSVYEVPDVKCWQCWRTFPTSKLMDEHRCAGEDGRPGGKCSKCSRNYALLKNLLKHEVTCTHKKKGEVTVDPDVQARLLPMRVRTARCDALLAASGHVDSSTVSHNYGLDSKCRYPYLSFNINAKAGSSTKPVKHTVFIDDSIKEEFCADLPCVLLNKDSNENSESEKLDTLSTMSLNSIFSKKCLEEEPQKQRKVKSEKGLDLLNADLDFSTKIENIIDNILDNLGNDDTRTSCSNDSDSILDKDNAKESVDVLKPAMSDEANKDNQDKTDYKNDDGIRNESPVNKDGSLTSCSFDSDSFIDKNNGKSAGTSDQVKNKEKVCEEVSEKFDVISEQAVETDKSSVQSKKESMTGILHENDGGSLKERCDELKSSLVNDVASKDEVSNDTSEKVKNNEKVCEEAFEKLDVISEQAVKTDKSSVQSDKESMSVNLHENDDGSIKERCDELKSSVVNDAASNDVSMDDTKINEKKNTESSNNVCNNQNDDNALSKTGSFIISTDYSKTENYVSFTNENDQKNDDVDSNNQLVQDGVRSFNTEDKRGSCNNASDYIESKDSERMDDDEQNYSTNKDNLDIGLKDFEKPSENYENLTKINEITNQILKDTESAQNVSISDSNYKHSTHKDDINDESHQESDPHGDLKCLNSINSGQINGVENQDKFNVNDFSYDDRKLMAELDAQIGKNDQKIDENNQKICENDQKIDENAQKSKEQEHLIDDSLKKQDLNLRSLCLESISDDEFNFDA